MGLGFGRFSPLNVGRVDRFRYGVIASRILALHLVGLTTLSRHLHFMGRDIGGAGKGRSPLVPLLQDANVGLVGNVEGEFLMNVLQHLDIPLAVVAHSLEGFRVVLENDSLPQVKLRLNLAAEAHELAEVVQPVAVEVELPPRPLERVHRLVIRHHGDAMEQAAGAYPRHVELITVVADGLVSHVYDGDELLEHGFVILVLVPDEDFGLLLMFPLVPDADDCPFLNDVVVVEIYLVADAPREYNVG